MLNIIPIPLECEETGGYFTSFDRLIMKSDFYLPLVRIETGENANLIILMDSSLEDEEYTLDISRDKIKITSSGKAGAYYALQTLRQLCRYELGEKRAPCCHIKDKPSFEWRGLQLDEGRHFFGKNEVKRFLDNMFMMKLNVFHWHLTDDQGWRIEIKKYPLLTEIGAVREYTQINGWGSAHILNERHSGFYTQDDIKEIVAYAAERGIMTVPEIDFPAHCASAIAGYPWLACRELDRAVPGYFGSTVPVVKLHMLDWNRPICPGKDKALDFVTDVIDEVCALFPAPYFHIGGDETPKSEWKKCPHCQQRMKENNLRDEEELQGWFNNKILEHLTAKGKRLIGWNEILKAGNLNKSVIGQYWTPKRDRTAEQFVNSGGNLILSNHQSFYFDMPYSRYPLKNTYNYSPEEHGVNAKNIKNVLGFEGETWTEWIDGREKLDCYIHPRMEALSEAAWSDNKNKDWQSFLSRLDSFKPFYKHLGINYAVDSVSMPKGLIKRVNTYRLFQKGDTHREVKINRKLKAKGEK